VIIIAIRASEGGIRYDDATLLNIDWRNRPTEGVSEMVEDFNNCNSQF
jgi:hypothetical protein